MKHLLLILALAAPGFAQYVRIADTIYSPWAPSTRWTGRMEVYAQCSMTYQGISYERGARVLAVNTSGTFSIQLIPNLSATVSSCENDQNLYRVRFLPGTGGAEYEQYWAFSYTTNTLTLADVRQNWGSSPVTIHTPEWLTGSGVPSSGNGAVGDLYVNTDNGNWYKKTASTTWTLQGNMYGTDGTNGVDGFSLRSGSGAPSNGLGNNGDLYLDTAASCLYGPKASGAWPGSCTSLVGPPGVAGAEGQQGIQGPPGSDGAPGVNGTRLHSGNGAPSGETGVNGDVYVDRSNGNWYEKSGGAWVLAGEWIAAGVNSASGTPSFIIQTQTAPTQPTYYVNGSPVYPCTGPSDPFIQLFIDSADGKLKSINCAGTVKTYYRVGDTVAIADGGTGQTNADAAFNALVPSQGGNAGKYLTTDGTNPSWATVTGSGSVTGLYSGTVNFTLIADGACQDQTISAPGATTGMSLAVALPGAIEAGLLPIGFVSAADTITFRACNSSGANVDPVSVTYYARNVDALGYLTASATIDPSPLADGACATAGTISVTGATTGDNVAMGWPSTLNAGVVGVMYVSAADTVTVRLCNWSGAEVNVTSSTFKAGITK